VESSEGGGHAARGGRHALLAHIAENYRRCSTDVRLSILPILRAAIESRATIRSEAVSGFSRFKGLADAKPLLERTRKAGQPK
jgi:hypothetical protein